MQLSPYAEAKQIFKDVVRFAIENRGRGRGATGACCLLSLDEEVRRMDKAITEKFGVRLIHVFTTYLEREALFSDLLDDVKKDVKEPRRFEEFLTRQFTFLLALSPVTLPGELLEEVYVLAESPRLAITFFDLAESIALQYALSRSAVAHIYLYGSSIFRRKVMEARAQMGEEKYKTIHDKTVVKEVAPSLYVLLSALNLVTNAIDEKLETYPTLGQLSVRRKLQAKVVIQTGIGAALAKALIYGVAGKTELYIPSFFVSAVLGNALLFNIWPMAQSQINAGQIAHEAIAIYKRVKEQIQQKVRAAGRLSLRQLEIYYELADAIRDSVLAYLIVNSERAELREEALNELLRIII
ncbi:hypothetical protein [Pyrobaculum sp.]|uniref:hypothetical protein n=1 Tax=Pyrobaculum sp. TaxID=2004705 RepID=UPI003161F92B